MSHILPIPSRREIRIAADSCISRWARAQGLNPGAVHRTINRYAGESLDLSRIWGLQTRRILLAIVDAVDAADSPDSPRPATGGGPSPTRSARAAASLKQSGELAESDHDTAPSAARAPSEETA